MRTALLLVLFMASAASARLLDRPTYLSPSSRVVGLYDSADLDARATKKVFPAVRDALSSLGLGLVTHDIASGLPSDAVMRDARAVVTSVSDPTMVAPLAYVAWLEKQLNAGKRVVILGNFGAYQDADTKGWTENGDVNRVFRQLGVSYGGQWTDKPEKLRVVGQPDPAINPRVDLGRAANYFLIRALSEDVTTHLAIERTDLPNSTSSIIFSSSHGGAALERYFDDADGTPLLDVAAFLRSALFPRRSPRVLVVVDPNESSARAMEDRVGWVMRYARLEGDFITLHDMSRLGRRDLEAYSTVLIATDGADQLTLEAAKAIEAWVREDGGGLVMAAPPSRDDWRKMFGIKAVAAANESVRGMQYTDKLYPGLDSVLVADLETENKEPAELMSMTAVTLSADATVLAYAVDPKNPGLGTKSPIVWRRRHGAGRIVVRNDTALTAKSYRGQLLHLIMAATPVSAAPLANAAVIFIDDCPQPMWDVKKAPISEEFGLSDTDFYKSVWWPDMMSFAKDFDLKYTFLLVFSYDGKTDTGFTADPFYSEGSKGVPAWMAHEALRLGHEVGLHGYNHQSLVTQKGPTSLGWPTRESMMESLALARAEWERLFGAGNMPFTYVAPNNHIHRAGKEALAAVFPEIRVMATLDTNEADIEGADFETDPDVAQFLDIPRVSSGFAVGPQNALDFHDAIMLAGVQTHFVHPDDVYDVARNGGKGWKVLRNEFRGTLKHVKETYPWLRSLAARDAYHTVTQFRTTPFRLEAHADKAIIHLGSGSRDKTWFQLRVDPETEVQGTASASLVSAYPVSGVYIFEAKGPEAVVRLTPRAADSAAPVP